MEKMSILEIVSDLLHNRYATFSGRAGRREMWAWYIFMVGLGFVVNILTKVFASVGALATLWGIVSWLINVGLVIPGIAVAVRRCHDTDHSGWWCLLIFASPIAVGIILMLLTQNIGFGIAATAVMWIYWVYLLYVKKGTEGPNQYGQEPSYFK